MVMSTLVIGLENSPCSMSCPQTQPDGLIKTKANTYLFSIGKPQTQKPNIKAGSKNQKPNPGYESRMKNTRAGVLEELGLIKMYR